jgi:hypothetical protein
MVTKTSQVKAQRNIQIYKSLRISGLLKGYLEKDYLGFSSAKPTPISHSAYLKPSYLGISTPLSTKERRN